MKTTRRARPEDIEAFKELWNMSFSDSENFRKWFFENRFVPDYSICIEEDGKIVSEAQSIPCHIKIRNAVLNGAIMVGACTHPDYKKRGYMKEIYTGYMNMVHDMGVVLCAHTPAVLRTYFYVGHLPVSDTAFLEIEKASASSKPHFTEFDQREHVSALMACYANATKKYSGIINRSFADFRLKMEDYAADGGKCVAVYENGCIKGYGVYYDTPEMVYGEEIIAADSENEQKVVDALTYIGNGKTVKIKLPPDTKSFSPQGKITTAPRNVLGLANVRELLKAVGHGLDFAVEVSDSVVPENNGVFSLKGEKTNRAPAFSTTAGNITQWLVGYRSIKELKSEGNAVVHNDDEVSVLDASFPKEVCHIIDEY
ncbi:MAG: GNAT family N-acetyltransferase [Firmicutes bacterium]|nr:GNAT family N-acetyltransferase [Bacillota bacterium]